jgi:hypothetical protein
MQLAPNETLITFEFDTVSERESFEALLLVAHIYSSFAEGFTWDINDGTSVTLKVSE